MVFPVLSAPADRQATERQRARGYAAGYAAGLQAAAAREAQAVDAAERLRAQAAVADAERVRLACAAAARAASAFSRATGELEQVAEQTVTEAALRLARAVLGAELADSGTAARAALARVTAAAEPAAPVRIRMHPDDVMMLGDELGWPVMPDATIERGDAIAELEDGWIDGRVLAAFDRAAAVLRGGDA
jgi:flagellar assembly protein FliH